MTDKKNPDHVAGLAIQIPQDMIEHAIRAQMVASIPNPEKWVEAIVRQACEEQDDRYGRRGETRMQKAIAEAIRQECEAVFKEWIIEHRAAIREALVKELTRGHAKRVKEIATKLADGLANVYTSNVNLKIED